LGSPVLGDHNTGIVPVCQDYYTATQEQLLQELVYPGTNISTIPITILTTILYTSKQIFFLNHNTGTILVYNTGTNLYTSIVHTHIILP
jgi:hypothetical protein